jgi:hypothetical protein
LETSILVAEYSLRLDFEKTMTIQAGDDDLTEMERIYGGQLDAVLDAWNKVHLLELRYTSVLRMGAK